MTDLVISAAQYAHKAHLGQFRKYTNKPFITHPARVAAAATVYFVDHPKAEEIISAAWLHDVVEDVKEYTFDRLSQDGFSSVVVSLCQELTSPSKGVKASRAERKQMDRDHLATVSHVAKILKLLDRQDNILDMVGSPLDFVELYVEETRLLAGVLWSADDVLAEQLLQDAEKTLKIVTALQRD